MSGRIERYVGKKRALKERSNSNGEAKRPALNSCTMQRNLKKQATSKYGKTSPKVENQAVRKELSTTGGAREKMRKNEKSHVYQ